jgi:hypothetical protein
MFIAPLPVNEVIFFVGPAAKANLVGGCPTPLKILVSWVIIGNIWKNKKCSRPTNQQ